MNTIKCETWAGVSNHSWIKIYSEDLLRMIEKSSSWQMKRTISLALETWSSFQFWVVSGITKEITTAATKQERVSLSRIQLSLSYLQTRPLILPQPSRRRFSARDFSVESF